MTTRILRVLAPNPSVYTLEGTNTWIVGGDPSVVIDPGPDDASHLQEVAHVAGRVGAILLTHGHEDHATGAPTLAAMSNPDRMSTSLFFSTESITTATKLIAPANSFQIYH